MTLYLGTVKLSERNELTIPTPQLHLLAGAEAPHLAVSYLPTPHTSWLEHNPEVWLFAYRRSRKNTSASAPAQFVHPTDSTKRDTSAALYAGLSKRKTVETSYATEYPFEYDSRPPAPYEQVPLTAFNHLEFYWHRAHDRRPVASDFPITKVGSFTPIVCPRMNGLRTRFQFRFAIDNPDGTAREVKLFSAPSVVLHCMPIYDGTFKTPQPDPASDTNARLLRFRFTL